MADSEKRTFVTNKKDTIVSRKMFRRNDRQVNHRMYPKK